MTDPHSAMVLAAGLGRRMRPLTDDRPKPMIEAAGRTLIDRTLDRLIEIGIERAVVNLHYLPDVLRAHLDSREAPGISYSDETALLLDTGGGIVQAMPQLGIDPFVVINSDNIWLGQTPLAPLVERWQPEQMDALLLLAPIETAVGYTREGDFFLENNRLVRRGQRSSAPLVFTGAQIIAPHVFEGAQDGPFSLNVIWDRIIAEGRAFGVVHESGWCDVGTPEGLRLAEAALDRV